MTFSLQDLLAILGLTGVVLGGLWAVRSDLSKRIFDLGEKQNMRLDTFAVRADEAREKLRIELAAQMLRMGTESTRQHEGLRADMIKRSHDLRNEMQRLVSDIDRRIDGIFGKKASGG